MANEQNRRALAGAAITHYQILLSRVRSGGDHIALREAGIEQAAGHGFRGLGDISIGIRGIDLDQLLKDRSSLLIRRCVCLPEERLRTNQCAPNRRSCQTLSHSWALRIHFSVLAERRSVKHFSLGCRATNACVNW